MTGHRLLVLAAAGLACLRSLCAQAAKDIPLPIVPSSPAFTLLGVEPAAVPRPGNVVDLAIGILSATDRLSVLPEDYALEVSPYWLFDGRDLTYREYARGGAGLRVMAQTLGISIAASSSAKATRDTGSTGLAVAWRFTLVRGPIDTAAGAYGRKLDSLYTMLDTLARDLNRAVAERVERDSLITALRQPARNGDAAARRRIAERQQAILEGLLDTPDRLREIRQHAADLEVRRRGWTLDAAGGAVFDFAQRAFDRGELSRWGAWLTGGYEGPKVSGLGVARFLADDRDAEGNTLDLGGRVLYDPAGRFSVSAEVLGRFFPASDTLDTQYRAGLVTEVALGRNQAVQVSFGRDFDGKRSGSLIAAVSVVLGFVWQHVVSDGAGGG